MKFTCNYCQKKFYAEALVCRTEKKSIFVFLCFQSIHEFNMVDSEPLTPKRAPNLEIET